jgi:hypothetical protein
VAVHDCQTGVCPGRFHWDPVTVTNDEIRWCTTCRKRYRWDTGTEQWVTPTGHPGGEVEPQADPWGGGHNLR